MHLPIKGHIIKPHSEAELDKIAKAIPQDYILDGILHVSFEPG